MIRELTSLQSPLSDLMAERAQTCPIVGSHLNLIVSPDDEVLQQQVGHIMAGNVLDLVVHRQPSETVPEIQMHPIWMLDLRVRVLAVMLYCTSCLSHYLQYTMLFARGRQSTSKQAIKKHW